MNKTRYIIPIIGEAPGNIYIYTDVRYAAQSLLVIDTEASTVLAQVVAVSICNLRAPLLRCGAVALVVGVVALGPAQAGLSSAIHIVLQKGRHYDPTDLFLRRGDTITLVNGDDNAVHHAFIEADRFAFDGSGVLQVGSDYAVKPLDTNVPPLFLNGLCEYTHGIGDAGSFSLLSLRAQTILNSVTDSLHADLTTTI